MRLAVRQPPAALAGFPVGEKKQGILTTEFIRRASPRRRRSTMRPICGIASPSGSSGALDTFEKTLKLPAAAEGLQ